MKIYLKYSLLTFAFATISMQAQKVESKYTTVTEKWVSGKKQSFKTDVTQTPDVIIYPENKEQEIEGFGACFNELGYEALQSVPAEVRDEILTDLFTADGVNFTVCRMPLASNDYSLSYYSYNDVPEDFDMVNFNIDRDRYILIPYIKLALQKNPDLKIWASPWSPPAWMKVNNHYAMTPSEGDLKMKDISVSIQNNATGFIMQERYLKAYALYFSKFIKAYKKEGVEVSRVMVQNEPVYRPFWPSCTWRPDDLAYYIGQFLGPRFEEDKLTTEIWLGTVNTSDPNFTRTILNNEKAGSYIKGVGFQWDAKNTIATLHSEYPNRQFMQTESECGNGENNWQSATYTWSLIKKYINGGVNSYMYWNMILDESGKSTWGWTQNMMIAINKETGTVTYNPEYYLMKHLSHYVIPGSVKLTTSNSDAGLAFLTPKGDIVYLYFNTDATDKNLQVQVNNKQVSLPVKANSINSFVWQAN